MLREVATSYHWVDDRPSTRYSRTKYGSVLASGRPLDERQVQADPLHTYRCGRRASIRRLRPHEDHMLELDRHQGRFGEHFAQLIVTAAGYTCYKPEDTGDGIDLVLTHTQHDGVTVRPPNVELQVKTVRTPTLVNKGTELSYDLEVAHYNALRAPGPTKRYLVVVVVPGDQPRDWYGQASEFTVFSEAAYWRDLLGEPTTPNTTTIAVRIPLANRYTPQIVQAHMSAHRNVSQSVSVDRSAMIAVDKLGWLARTPYGAAAYMHAHGWQILGATSTESLWKLIVDGQAWEALLPLDMTGNDAQRRINDFLSVLSAVEKRPAEDLINDLRTAQSDVIRIRATPESDSGTAPLEEALEIVSATRDMLLAAAAAVDAPRAMLAPRKPDRAIEFVRSVKLSTDPGSFVVALEAPVAPDFEGARVTAAVGEGHNALFPDPRAPFARKVTELLVNAIDDSLRACAEVEPEKRLQYLIPQFPMVYPQTC